LAARSLSLSWLARVPELEILAIPPRETLTLASAPPREDAGAPGPRRAADPDPDAVAPRPLIEVGLARIGPEFAGSLPVCAIAGGESGWRGLPRRARAVIGFGDFFRGRMLWAF